MLKILCQTYTCSYPKHFATTNYTFELFYLTYKFLLFYSHYLYTYAHRRANLASRTHLHSKRNFHAIYLYLRGNSTSYIHLGSILMPFLTWVHFFERILMLPIHKYTYFERHFLLFIHTLQGIFMPYIHIFTYR